MRSKEREKWMALLSDEREAHRAEVQKLLDRIQHPERVLPSEPIAYEQPDPPKADYAYVGEMVPDFVDVGTPKENNAEH